MLSFSRTLFALVCAVAAAAAPANHQVVVGGAAGKQFTPSQLTAAVGDTVTFVFSFANHTATQSSFATPCELLQNGTQSGFNSGFQVVAQNASESPAWTLEVTSDAPIWYFCAQMGHCQAGMVGSINAPATGNKTFATFQALAMDANGTAAANTSVTAGVVSSGVGAGATAAASAVSAAATATGSGAAAGKPAAASALSVGGSAIGLGLAAAVFVLL